ncbi:MAG TPA: zinc ABC transporter ATP-binding protein AztA [Devosia sp.]|nr:zinc ABC transporter ATP-binding protein AztA [Devosia sp.]
MSGAVRLEDLTLGYDGHPAVHHLSGTFEPGSLTAIVGPNGSGKSTLLKGIVGTLQPLGGRVGRTGDIAYLPQSAEIDRSFPATVDELVGLGLWKRRGVFGSLRPADRQAMASALAAVGLDGFARRPIDTLSGGQLQRALFARVLLQDASVVLLDEPFTAIDEKTVRDLVELVMHWHAEGRTVISVLHDLELVRRHFPQTLLLAREPIAWGRTAVALKPENLQRARGMPEAWDERAPWHDDNAQHAGHVH